MHMFSFSVIIPVKSFEQTLNLKSLHLYRQKSGRGGGGAPQVQQQYLCFEIQHIILYRVHQTPYTCTHISRRGENGSMVQQYYRRDNVLTHNG